MRRPALIFACAIWTLGVSGMNTDSLVHIPDMRLILCDTLDCGTISAPPGYSQYSWSHGEISQTVTLCVLGNYYLTVTDAEGCTGTATIVVSDQPATETVHFEICEGDYIIYHGVLYDIPGSFTDTLYNPWTGCPDMIYLVNIVVRPLEVLTYKYIYCQGETPPPLPCDSVWPYLPCTLFAAAEDECDTLVEGIYVEVPHLYATVAEEVCPGDSVQIAGKWYYHPGAYLDTIPSASSECDSILDISIVVSALSEESVELELCNNNPIVFQGTLYSAEGTYRDTSSAGGDCVDYTVTVIRVPEIDDVIILPDMGAGSGAIEIIADPSNSYVWEHGATGMVLTNLFRGTYRVTVTDNYGCVRELDYYVPGPLDIGDEKGSDEEVEIYPNPGNGDFTVDISALSTRDVSELVVFDQTGRIHKHQGVRGAQTASFQLSSPPGVYFVKLVGERGYIAVLKLIKTH